MPIVNAYLYFAVIGGMFVGLCIWFDRIRRKQHKKVLSNRKKRELSI
jgi:hypothetical protein